MLGLAWTAWPCILCMVHYTMQPHASCLAVVHRTRTRSKIKEA
jgi:hypothetical protein